MKVILVCSDYQKKMFPYDKEWQTASLEILNTPNIIRQIDFFLQNGIQPNDIYVYLAYQQNQVIPLLKPYEGIHLGKNYKDFREFLSAYASTFDDQTLIVKSDYVFVNDDLHKVINHQDTDFVMLTEKQESTKAICANVANEKISYFLGHPRDHYVTHEVAGIYCLSKQALDYVIHSSNGFDKRISGSMIPDQFYIENGLNQFIESGNQIKSVIAQYNVFQLLFPWSILDANNYHLNRLVALLPEESISSSAKIEPSASINGKLKVGENSYIGKNVIINGNVVIGENVVIDNGAILNGNILIGDHSYVKDYAKIEGPTVIGKENKFGHNAEFKGVSMKGVSAIHYSEMFGVIGRYVDIAAACVCGILRFNDTEQPHKISGQTYTAKHSNAVFVGDYTRTGINNVFLPGNKIGSNSALYPGLIVEKDVPHETIVLKKQETVEQHWGPNKYGW
ncbi:hypothetical protein SFC15_21695 [Shouchella clausii]